MSCPEAADVSNALPRFEVAPTTTVLGAVIISAVLAFTMNRPLVIGQTAIAAPQSAESYLSRKQNGPTENTAPYAQPQLECSDQAHPASEITRQLLPRERGNLFGGNQSSQQVQLVQTPLFAAPLQNAKLVQFRFAQSLQNFTLRACE